MIKAVKDFVEDGRQIKAGDEIKPDTFTADTLLDTLFLQGWIVEVKPEKNDSESRPAHKTAKAKVSKTKE
jgi:hypothetical protein